MCRSNDEHNVGGAMELIKSPPTVMKAKTYTMTLQCYNCGKEGKYEIPWGVMVANCDTTCFNCGCSRKAVDEASRKRQEVISGPRAV